MNPLVLLFFAQNVLASLLLGGKFAARKDPVFKSFGVALLFDAAAFAVWSYAVITRPTNLQDYVSIGAVLFIISLVFLLATGVQRLEKSTRSGILALGALIGAGIFLLGRQAANPSIAGFSSEGFFFFNVHPLLQALYVFAFVLAAFPAIEALTAKFTGAYAWLVRYGFSAQVAGGVLLITAVSTTPANTTALYLTGWIIGIAYFLLWATLLFSRKAWSNSK